MPSVTRVDASQEVLFHKCPLCGGHDVEAGFSSMEKDLSRSGFRYERCFDCKSYYLVNVRHRDLDNYYAITSVYESNTPKDRIAEELVATLATTSTKQFADLGCGSGAWAIPMMNYCDRITCVDLCESNLTRLRALTPRRHRSKLECHAQSTLEFLSQCSDAQFDIVLSMFSLEHDATPERTLGEIRRVLRPGGKAVVLVPSANALQLLLLRQGFYWFQAPWHTFIPSRLGLRLMASRAGFSSTRTFVPRRDFYGWFWLRGLADATGLRSMYDLMRKSALFITCDKAIDQTLDRLATMLRRPSCVFYVLTAD